MVPPPLTSRTSSSCDGPATDGSGRVVAEGEIDRAIVDRDRFLRGTVRTDSGR